MITCSRCKETKDETEFYRSSTRPNGYQPYCKTCKTEARNLDKQQNPDKYKESHRKYYEEHKGEPHPRQPGPSVLDRVAYDREYNQRYFQTDRGKEAALRGRTKRRSNAADEVQLSIEDIKFLLELQNYRCCSCGTPFSKKDKMEVDHILPLSKGGKLKLSNAQLLCRHCNRTKHDNHMDYISYFICTGNYYNQVDMKGDLNAWIY